VTIFKTILSRGYFPKELPPSFYTELFADYATTKAGRKTLEIYKATDGITECAHYDLATPGLTRRPLRIPHPASYARLSQVASRHFARLLRQAAHSPFSKSRPIYSSSHHRALRPMVKPQNLVRERMAARAGASYLVKVDINQFYSSLYTHAVGWAISPQTRLRKNWKNPKLLGKKLDDALMQLQGRVSQGIPIGPDLSLLFAEIVLGQVDRLLKVPPKRAYRWFDDYELSCDTKEEAEFVLTRLVQILRTFQLRPNVEKTAIERLPVATQDEWQAVLSRQSNSPFKHPNEMVGFLDAAFSLRTKYLGSPVLLYALGLLFKLRDPGPDVGRIAESGITQALLMEPGAAQKAFALVTYWALNGYKFDRDLFARTVSQMIARHRGLGVSSDVCWAIAFCLEHSLPLDASAGKVLAACDDGCVALQALDAHSRGLLPKGFTTKKFRSLLADASLDGPHWLLAYEAHRQGFLNESAKAIAANPLFAEMLARNVTFYRPSLPPYALVIQPGGAPEWVVEKWINVVLGKQDEATAGPAVKDQAPVLDLLRDDVKKVGPTAEASAVLVVDQLLNVRAKEGDAARLPGGPAPGPGVAEGAPQPAPAQPAKPAPAQPASGAAAAPTDVVQKSEPKKQEAEAKADEWVPYS
jgi:hypothetical protein